MPQSFEQFSRRRKNAQGIRGLLSRNESFLSYATLVGFRRQGFRNRNWARLQLAEKALFRCALWVAKVRGKISNTRLMVQVLEIALKLTENFRSHIVKAGTMRSLTLYKTYSKPNGVFDWAPHIKDWLSDRNFIRYLGILEVNAT